MDMGRTYKSPHRQLTELRIKPGTPELKGVNVAFCLNIFNLEIPLCNTNVC